MHKLLESVIAKNSGDIERGNVPGLITYINPYSYLMLRKARVHLDDYASIYIDGSLLVIFFRLLLRKSFSRISFDMTSAAPVLFEAWQRDQKTVYFIGAQDHEMSVFIDRVSAAFPTLSIAGWQGGHFKDKEDRDAAISRICHLRPEVLIVGMGAPLQERFLQDVVAAGWGGIGHTCGGFIHQTATKLAYYPELINKFNLRWLYRIYDEPKLAKRYMLIYPYALWLIFFDMLPFRRRLQV